MEIAEIIKQESLENNCFYDPIYLSQVRLDEKNWLQYFMLSEFYDKKSINQQMAEQGPESKIEGKSGIEYKLVKAEKDLFTIKKYFRKNTTRTFLGYYYIYKGRIFQGHDLYSIVSSNIQSVANNFTNILNDLNKSKE